MTFSPLFMLLLPQIPPNKHPHTNILQMNWTSNPELGWESIKINKNRNKNHNKNHPEQLWVALPWLHSGEPGADFGHNHSLTPPTKGWESQNSVLWESAVLIFLLSDPSFSSWLLCPVDFRCKRGKLSKNRYLHFKKQETNGLVIFKTLYSALRSKKENVQKTYRQNLEKKIIKKCPLKCVQIWEQSVKLQDGRRGHGSSQTQNIPTPCPRKTRAWEAVGHFQFGEWFPTQYTPTIAPRCKANQRGHIHRNRTWPSGHLGRFFYW